MTLKGHMHTITSADGAPIAYYHVQPSIVRLGGLVLIQEIFGVTDHIKELCDGFAADGYEVIAPSLFDRAEPGFAVGYEPADIDRAKTLAGTADWDLVTADLQACVDRLRPKGSVLMTGYCFGGSATWVAACRVEGITAAAAYYGRLIVDFVEETPRCPIILHYGEHDASIPMSDVERVRARHPEIPVYVYPAGHGFNSDRRADYNPDCTRIARERTLEHFATYR